MQTLSKNTNNVLLKSTEECRALTDKVLALAKKYGATDAHVDLEYDRGFSVDVRLGSVETVAFAEDKSISVVIYFDKQHGAAASSDMSDQALDAMVSAACDIAKVSAVDECVGLPDNALITDHYPDLDLMHFWSVTPAEAIDQALRCEDHARALDHRIKNSDGVSVSSYMFSSGYANSRGGFGIVPSSRHSLSCSLIAQEKDSMQREYEYTVARDARHMLSPEIVAAQAVERVVSRLGATKLKTQKVPVLFSSRIGKHLFSVFMSAISGSNLYRKNTFLLNALDQQVFPGDIQIYEQPHLLGALGSSPFDDDGVLTRSNVFVQDGYLRQYVLDTYSARRLGLQTTANAGGVFNLTIPPTAGDLNDLLKRMHTGLLVTQLMGEGINILTGDYSRGASGFWVENGKIQYPVEEITIAGQLKDMLAGIVAVGNDIDPNYATRCGSVLVNEMMVAGN